MMQIRDTANYHRISFFHIPEKHIDKIALELRDFYRHSLKDEFEKYFNTIILK